MSILTIGNALTDVLVRMADDSVLTSFSIPKGSMALLDNETDSRLQKALASYPSSYVSGGSAANTAYGLAKLGIQAGFAGSIGKDLLGEKYSEDLTRAHVKLHLQTSTKETGHCISMISPDSERTMGTYLGAAIDILPEQISAALITSYQYVYLEGYLMSLPGLIRHVAALAKENKVRLILDLASYNVVAEHYEAFKQLITQHAYMVLANEEEARQYALLSGIDSQDEKMYEQVLDLWSASCEVAIVKLGPKGSLIRYQGKTYTVPVAPAPHKIDTTGAGDLFASGFLYGWLKGYSPDVCGYIGSIVSGYIIEQIGVKMPDSKWEQTLRDIKTYLKKEAE